jgi:hypothetical protein
MLFPVFFYINACIIFYCVSVDFSSLLFYFAFDHFLPVYVNYNFQVDNTPKVIPGTRNYLGLILGLLGIAVLFLCWCRKKNSQHRKDNVVMENNLQDQIENCESQKDAQMDSQKDEDENKAKLYGLALDIEVDHTADNVSSLHDIELPSEEIFDDRTAGFSAIEFCTVYENNLHGNNMHM